MPRSVSRRSTVMSVFGWTSVMAGTAPSGQVTSDVPPAIAVEVDQGNGERLRHPGQALPLHARRALPTWNGPRSTEVPTTMRCSAGSATTSRAA